MDICCVVRIVSTQRIGTSIELIDLLINVYRVVFIVVPAMTCCGTANVTVANAVAATIAVIANIILLVVHCMVVTTNIEEYLDIFNVEKILQIVYYKNCK
jgi:hypothetical protein